ncbi:Hint domain-containing protein [Dinoroseobacter sp. PD6]|uniref:Hint domain-containing protein n=1 Tax=Dinoroseobacter sp. PD6 TaxID=3028384 RepID=UPI00237AA291|nr:Hint domain-containing protein [Dinoroseobacter sp. PD6]MDD9716001.1 Hint domain-containing protein [Dinoroseobacter sp. PD6]
MEWQVPGFGPETRIMTTLGAIPAGLLRRGDEVITPSGLSCGIEWLDRVGLDADFLASNPNAHPRVIPAGSLGAGLPERDLVVSAGQQMMPGKTTRATPGLPLPPEAVCKVHGFQYTLFHCGRPVQVLAEGVWCPVDELSSLRGRRSA